MADTQDTLFTILLCSPGPRDSFMTSLQRRIEREGGADAGTIFPAGPDPPTTAAHQQQSSLPGGVLSSACHCP
jgi:hypothetical protein